MGDEFSFDVFLSHSSMDKDVARSVAKRLRADGLKVWFDEWVLKPGDRIFRLGTVPALMQFLSEPFRNLRAGFIRLKKILKIIKKYHPWGPTSLQGDGHAEQRLCGNCHYESDHRLQLKCGRTQNTMMDKCVASQ